MPHRFESLEERLDSCSSWVQQTFHELEASCRKSGGHVMPHDEAKCEGRLFRVYGSRTTFCRLDPKVEHIGIGFTNDIRHLVANTGRLRKQRNMAWVTIYPEDWGADQYGDVTGEITNLIRKANEVVRSRIR
jgi:hypothetical protein